MLEMFNVISFLVAIQIVCVVYGQQEKFVIENKRTGMVVERIVGGHRLVEWDNTDSQLWTLEGHNSSGYIIRNVASRTFIECNRGSVHYYKWKLNIPSETRIEIKSPNVFLTQENQFLMCMYDYNSDENDRWLFIEQSKKNNMKFVIENKETGEILEEEDAAIKMGKWDSKDSQLWTLKLQNKSGYSIVNVASGNILTYSKNGSEYDAWKVKARGDTYIKVEHPNVFLANRNGKPVFIGDKQIDDSATWLLIEKETKHNKTEPKRIYVEDYQERFVIENSNTGEVLEEVDTILKMGKWENKDSQLWILKRNLSGYRIVNVASGGILTYDQNGTDLQIWNLNTQVASPVQLDGTNVFLFHKDGEVVSTENNQNNESDKWIFTEHTFKKIDKKPKQIHIIRYQSKFVIKNKKTGEVLEELDSTLKLRDWQDRGTQLWTLKPENESGYSIVNVASGRILTYSNNGTTYDIWKLKTQSDSLIQIEGHNIFLANRNGKPVFIRYKQNEDTDRWMLTERELMKVNKKPKRIHVEIYEQKFVIENKKTGMVLDIPMEQYLGMRNWENRNTQMWTLEPQEKSGYYVIRNVANRIFISKVMDDRYKKSRGNAGLEGVQFQLDLLTVFLLNALQKLKDWKISTENQEAGKYDDLVLELPDQGVFLQAKFKQTKKITRDQLFSTNSKNSDFSLPKYFFSYLQIKTQVTQKTVILCTNTDIEEKGLEDVLIRHRVSPDSMLYCEGPQRTFFTFSKNVLPYLKASAEIYFNKNLQGKGIEKTVITSENIEDYLENLHVFSNYPSDAELRKIIDRLLSVLNDSNFAWKASYQELYKKVEDWFKQTKGEYLTEVRANAMFIEIKSDKYCEMLKNYNVSFEHNNFKFAGSKRVYQVNTERGHLLQTLKIFHALQDDKSGKLYISPDDDIELQKRVVEAFELCRYVYLIMIWPNTGKESIKREICIKLSNILKKDKYKKVILVTENNKKLAEQFEVNDISQIDGSINFDNLSKESQEILLKKNNIVFQDKKTNLEELLEMSVNENYTKSLHSEVLEMLIKGQEVKVGVRPLDLDEDTARYYVPRKFRSETRQSRKRKHIISEESIYDVNERVILIIDSAGMGKSTILTKLALVIKERSPHLWVIRIDLNEYTRILRDSLRKNKKTISVLELLNSQEATKLTNPLEELVFSMNGKVLLMMDGVDEISPDYTDLIRDLLSQCQKAPNFVKIFVTTRPHVSQELKGVLNCGCFKMLPFTRCNQVEFLTSYWTHNLQLDNTLKDKCKRYADTLITKISSWINSYQYGENLFAAVPLQVRMLAEIFQEDIPWRELMNWEGCKEYIEGNDVKPKLPEKINIVRLYDMFIEKKRDVFVDKGNPSGNLAANQALMSQFEECLSYHRNLALKVILKESEYGIFSERYAGDKYTEDYILKIGVVQKSGNKFQFVHRTFAEYFLADSISRELQLQNPNIEFQRFLIDVILLRPEFRVVRAFLDKFLQNIVDSLPSNTFKNYQSFASETGFKDNPIFVLSKEGWVALLQLVLKSINFRIIRSKEVDITDWRVKVSVKKRNTLNDLKTLVRKAGINIKNKAGNTPLHCAVKGCHLDMVKFLTKQGANINSRNGYSDTALHLSVVRDRLDIVEYLVKHGADVNLRNDKRFTALHLAAGFGEVSIVNHLVDHGSHINSKEQIGRTALHLAAERGKIDTVRCLVEHGAHVNLRDKRGCTAMNLASERGELDTVEYLAKCEEYKYKNELKLQQFT